jgi:long-chain acyl-CoA synthetase
MQNLAPPPACPPDIDWATPFDVAPLWTLLDNSIARWANRPCLDFMDKKYSYAEVGDLVARAAAGLQAAGLKPGDRVGLFLPNCPYSTIFFFGILRAGGIVVNFNPLYAEHEIRNQIRDSGTRIMVTLDLEALYPKIAPMLGTTDLDKIIVCSLADILPFTKKWQLRLFRRSALAAIPTDGRHIAFQTLIANTGKPAPVACDPERDVAVLQYTGGTTGTPKGAMLSHRNLFVNAQQGVRCFPTARPGHERVLAVIPFFHVFALTVAELGAFLGGHEIIMLPRFEVKQLLETVHKKKPTMMPGVPTILTAINGFEGIGRYDLSSIKFCLSGGSPLPIEVKTTFERLTGCNVLEGYGLSETSPIVTANAASAANPVGSAGLPVPGTEIEIRAPGPDGEPLAPGERGEVCIRGPQVMLGYWKQPEETAAVLRDGLLRTGDIGYLDGGGYLFLVDRIKDVIIAGGYKIFPRIVEEAIYTHPAVAECIVAGLPDKYRGQTVKAYVVLRPGEQLDSPALEAFLGDKISRIEMPKSFEFRDSLPKTPIGKLSKKALLDEESARQTAA